MGCAVVVVVHPWLGCVAVQYSDHPSRLGWARGVYYAAINFQPLIIRMCTPTKEVCDMFDRTIPMPEIT